MSEAADSGEIEVVVETDLVDVDGDGVVDMATEVTTIVADVDGDGVADVIQRTTTTAYDVDGDGVPDVIESTTVTGADVNQDGTIDEDEISVETTVAVREDLLDRRRHRILTRRCPSRVQGAGVIHAADLRRSPLHRARNPNRVYRAPGVLRSRKQGSRRRASHRSGHGRHQPRRSRDSARPPTSAGS